MSVTPRFVIPCPYCEEHRPDNLMPMHLNSVHPELSRIQIVAIVERGIRHAQQRHQLAEVEPESLWSPWRILWSLAAAAAAVTMLVLYLALDPPDPPAAPAPTPTVWTPTP